MIKVSLGRLKPAASTFREATKAICNWYSKSTASGDEVAMTREHLSMDHDEFLDELGGKEAAETTGRGYSG